MIPSPTSNMKHYEINAADHKKRLRAIALSFVVGLTLMGLKFLTYRITHSSAVLSDALESIINVVASAFAMLSIWMAAKPPDKDHPYGHGKIEYFSAGFEGALIIFAAGGIFYSGINHLRHPQPLLHLQEGLLILMVATIANLLLGFFLVRAGRRTNSMALTADGKHILTDVYSSAGVLIGLLLVYLTGQLWLDGLIACLIGVNILITGSKLVRQAFARLMDASDPKLLDVITRLLGKNRRSDWIDIHQLRAWRAGNLIHMDLHLVLPSDLSLEKAHQEAKILEALLMKQFQGNASVLVHMDPCKNSECSICHRDSCDLRHQQQINSVDWTHERLTLSPDGQKHQK